MTPLLIQTMQSEGRGERGRGDSGEGGGAQHLVAACGWDVAGGGGHSPAVRNGRAQAQG